MIRLLTNQTTIANVATVTGVTGALMLALNINMFVLAYALFTTSAVLWSVFAYRDNNRQLLTMNIIFGVINVIGLFRFS